MGTLDNLLRKKESLLKEIESIDSQVYEYKLNNANIGKYLNQYIKFRISPCTCVYMHVTDVSPNKYDDSWKFEGSAFSKTIYKIKYIDEYNSRYDTTFQLDQLEDIEIISPEQFLEHIDKAYNSIKRLHENH